MFLGQKGRLQVRQLEHGLQPGAAAFAQHGQPALEQVARIGGLLGQVGDDAHCHQVQQPDRFISASGAGIKRLCQLIGHAHPWQPRKRVLARLELGIDQREGLRELLGQGVVVSDNHVYPALPGVVERFMRGNAGVAGEHQARAAVQQRLQIFNIHPVRFSRADGDVVNHFRAQAAQRRYQQRGGSLPVYVKIAPHQDGLPPGDSALDAQAGFWDAR